jgi:hypothetical protein
MRSVNFYTGAVYKLNPNCHNGSLAPRYIRIMFTYLLFSLALQPSASYDLLVHEVC